MRQHDHDTSNHFVCHCSVKRDHLPQSFQGKVGRHLECVCTGSWTRNGVDHFGSLVQQWCQYDCNDWELCSLKSARAAFRIHLTRFMESTACESCKVNLDLLAKLEIRPEDGVQHYSYLLCYLVDILGIHNSKFQQVYTLYYSISQVSAVLIGT